MKNKLLPIIILAFLAMNANTNAQCSVSTPEICLVTVDTVGANHNTVMWDKPVDPAIDSFKIYREITSGVYACVGAVEYSALSTFEDLGSNPNLHSYRYKISALDTCGTETPLSPYHETIFTSYLGGGNFSWNDYGIEGSPSESSVFELQRDDTGVSGVWHPVNSMPAIIFTMQDLGYASFPSATYQIYDIMNYYCDPSRATVNTSRSNIKNQGLSTGIQSMAYDAEIFHFSPNPNTGIVHIKHNSATNIIKIELHDLLGRSVMVLEHPDQKQIDISSLENGIYLIDLLLENDRLFSQRIVIDKP